MTAQQQRLYAPQTQEVAVPAEAQVWYPDSGATHHVTSDLHHLAQSTSFSGSDQVHISNGQGLDITSIGSSTFLSPSNPTVTLALNDLLLVPSITKNLVYVSKFAKDNRVYFEFHSTTCFVKCQDSNKVLLEGHLDSDGLYCFQPIQFLPSSSKSLSTINTITKSTPLLVAAAD